MNNWLHDFQTALAFLTRLPMPHADGPMPSNFARANRMFPVVGALIGCVAGVTCLALRAFGLPIIAAAALALGVSAILTGALHEDGLADVADGFGGGRDKAAKLEIMRDSRLGTYGALILLVSFVTKVSAIAALPGTSVVTGLIAAHALARGILPLMSMSMTHARPDGLAATAGRPDPQIAATAILFAVIIAFLALSWTNALIALFVVAAVALAMAMLARRQIGGQTGDVLGATEQICETAILALLAARLS